MDWSNIFSKKKDTLGMGSTTKSMRRWVEEKLSLDETNIYNSSPYSAFHRLLESIFLAPINMLMKRLEEDYFPSLFLASAKGDFLDLHGASLGTPRLESSAVEGVLLFIRSDAEATRARIDIPLGTPIESVPLQGKVFRLLTTQAQALEEGELEVLVPVVGSTHGSQANLGEGLYVILPENLQASLRVTNLPDWRTKEGKEREEDEAYRKRLVLRKKEGQYPRWKDYRFFLAEELNLPPDNVLFEYPLFDSEGQNLPGEAKAYVWPEVIREEEAWNRALQEVQEKLNHEASGLGDRLTVIEAQAWPLRVSLGLGFSPMLKEEEKSQVLMELNALISAMFRGNSSFPEVKRLGPKSAFVRSLVDFEIHRLFAGSVYSVEWLEPTQDAHPGEEERFKIPTLESLEIREIQRTEQERGA